MKRLAALALLVLAGCSGGDDEATTTATTITAPTATETQAPATAGSPGDTLVRFARAARRQDEEGMWNLLAKPTQVRLGPTLSDFTQATAQQFVAGVGTMAKAKNFRLVLSKEVQPRVAVAAVAGNGEGGATEYLAYGAALVREGGGWKIDLGEIGIGSLTPAPLATVEPRPIVGVGTEAAEPITRTHLWLDGKSLRAQRLPAGARQAISGRPAGSLKGGWHVAVAFARTKRTASAIAWTFQTVPG